MTLHAVFSADLAPAAAPAALRVAALSPQLAALFFDGPAPGRLSLRLPGAAAGAQLATRLARTGGGARHLVLTTADPRELCRRGAEAWAGDTLVARIDPLALQSPLADPMALLAGLDEAGALRLLRLVLTTGASLFGGGALEGFGALAAQLVEQLAAPALTPVAAAAAGSGSVLTYRLGAAPAPAGATLLRLGRGRVQRLTGAAAILEVARGERLLHLCLPGPVRAGEVLVGFGPRPLRFGVVAAAAAFDRWLAARGEAAGAAVLGWLGGHAARDAAAAALLRETECPAAELPRADLLHLAATPEGLLVLAALEDPWGLADALRLETASGCATLPLDALLRHPSHGTVTAAFAELPGAGRGELRASLVWQSGRETPIASLAAEPLRGVPDAWRALPVAAAGPLAAALKTLASAGTRRRRTETFGLLPRRAALTLIAEGAAPAEYLHALFARIAAEPEAARIRLLLALPEGPEEGAAAAEAEALAAVHGIGVRLVAVAGGTAAERLRAGLAEAAGAPVLVLRQAALPVAPGWAAAARRALSRGREVVRTGAAETVGGASAEGACFGLPGALAARIAAEGARLADPLTDLAAAGLRLRGGLPLVMAYAPERQPTPVEAAVRRALLAGRA